MNFKQIIKSFNDWYCAAYYGDDGEIGVLSWFIKRSCTVKAWEKAMAVRMSNYAKSKGYIFDIFEGYVKLQKKLNNKVMNNEYVNFLNNYVRLHLSYYTAEIAVALKHIGNRYPLDSFLCNIIWGCFSDYINDYDLDEDTNMEEYFDKDVEEILFDAIDTEIK